MVNESGTATVDLSTDFDSTFRHTETVINITVVLIAVAGLFGNFLCFKTASYLPEATSKYIVKYLAFWDSLAALEATLFFDLFYDYLLPWAGHFQVDTLSPVSRRGLTRKRSDLSDNVSESTF